jgi:hypothetical protein
MPPSDAEELFMTKAQYEVFEALNPFFEVVMEGIRGLVDGHYFDTIAEDAFFEFRYLSLPKILSGASAFEINDIQDIRMRPRRRNVNNVTLP